MALPSNLPRTRIIDLIRLDTSVIVALADLGITPRYLYWTLDDASRDLGLNFDGVMARIARAIPPAALSAA